MVAQTKICQNCQKEFIIEPEDFEFYEKIKVPSPTFCPECRMIRRMMFRNERNLYKRKCDLCGENIISIYSSDKNISIYCSSCWYSDNWNPMEYGRDYNWNKPFFKQFKELSNQFPHPALYQINCINSPFVNREHSSKNCYLNFGGIQNENSAYNTYALYSKEVFDNWAILKSELSYDNVFCRNCYRLFFSMFCFNCHDVYFSLNCRNCNSIISCANLRNKSYYIFNKPVSKNEYRFFLKKYNLGNQKTIFFLKDYFFKIKKIVPNKFNFSANIINCSGDFLEESKNCKFCFNIEKMQDCKYVLIGGWAHSSYDLLSVGPNCQFSYEFANGGESNNVLFSYDCLSVYNIIYCKNLNNCHDCFGCIGLRNKQYCILNKQYTKEEYERLVPKIIEHMNKMPYISKIQKSKVKSQNDNSKVKSKEIIYKYGEFFPPELSPFAYNETIAQEYFPLTKKEAIEKGYRWKDPEERNIIPDIKTEELPDNIKDVDDSIVGKIIQCATCTQNGREQFSAKTEFSNCTMAFKIIPQELEFYRKMNLPLPRLCPNCRHYQRLKQRNPLKLWHRKCMCGGRVSANGVYKNTIAHFHGDNSCPNEFQTTYAPERPEIVYCEKCYLQEVV